MDANRNEAANRPDLERLQKDWDAFGRIDPLWAIDTRPDKRDGKWNEEEFFQTGRRFIDFWIQHLGVSGIHLSRERAMDFGCGAGRLTQALCRHFHECVGIDIAPSMVGLARRYNRFGDQCRYLVSTDESLSEFESGSFDCITTYLVLQHIPPEHHQGYLTAFLRLLKREGILLMQLPSVLKRAGLAGENPSLPPEAFRAGITIVDCPATLLSGKSASVVLRIRNESPVAWPGDGQASPRAIQLGNHWSDPTTGEMIVRDDGRIPLPRDLQPGEWMELTLPIRGPLRAGVYHLQFDLVQEEVAWFEGRGSKCAQVSLPIVPDLRGEAESAGALENSSEIFLPVMQMHGTPKTEVMALVESQGGSVLEVHEDTSAGDAWVSHLYLIRKE